MDSSFLHADTSSDQTGQISLRWAHMPFCWFCHEVTHFCFKRQYLVPTIIACSLNALEQNTVKILKIWTPEIIGVI